MFMMEFHPAEGGLDAELFAAELAGAVAKYAGMSVKTDGRVASVVASHRL